jgi:nucleotide-binding universal stress UspA family protein
MNFNRSSFLTKNTYMSITASQKTIFSKILIAIDGSDASMDAADYAVSISEQYNAELCALHVIHPADADLYGSTGEMTTAAYNTIDMNNEAQKYLDKVKLKANEKNIHIITEIIASTDTDIST